MGHTDSPVTVQAPVLSLLRDVLVYYSGAEKCRRGHRWGPLARDHYVIHAVSAGAGVFYYGQQRWELAAGDLFLIRPGIRTEYAADRESPWEYAWLAFNGLQAEALVQTAGFHSRPALRSAAAVERMTAGRARLAEAAQLPAVSRQLAEAAVLYEILAVLVRENREREAAAATEKSNSNAHIQQAVDFIDRNFSREISVGELAAYVGLDRSHLSHLFARILNTSPSAYIQTRRLMKARELLLNTTLSVKEIAYSCGFTDPLYFSRCFKKIHGCTPTSLRH